MEFDQNATVFTANGQHVGQLDRVVVAPATKAITHIIVRKGFLFGEDKVVPVQMVEQATQEGITLRENAGDLQGLPSYNDTQYEVSGASGGGTVVSQSMGGMPGAYVVEPRQKYVKHVEHHIPEGTVALKEGAKVTSADGKHIGHLERVILGPDGSHATELLVCHGKLNKETHTIPMVWVNSTTEDEVRLNRDAAEIEDHQ